MKPRYSGRLSKEFWHRINSLDKRKGELYSMGCILQNIEGFVLEQLKISEYEEKKA